MRKIILFLGFGLLFIWGIFGAFWGIYSATNPQAGMGISLKVADIAQGPYFIPGLLLFVAVMMGASFAPLVKGLIDNAAKKKHLQQIGQKGMAKIIDIQLTGIRVNDNSYVKITVELKGVAATFQTILSPYSGLRKGDMIEVLYDPANPQEIMPAGSL